jgi:diadenosine tetraphosphate (Ap4A) HIT family hydrolase
LIIPKHHGVKLTDIPDESLTEILSVAKKIAAASGATDWNLLQNNGRAAHQLIDHVHFHVIPKPNEDEGLGVGWPMKEADKGDLKTLFEDMKSKM